MPYCTQAHTLRLHLHLTDLTLISIVNVFTMKSQMILFVFCFFIDKYNVQIKAAHLWRQRQRLKLLDLLTLCCSFHGVSFHFQFDLILIYRTKFKHIDDVSINCKIRSFEKRNHDRTNGFDILSIQMFKMNALLFGRILCKPTSWLDLTWIDLFVVREKNRCWTVLDMIWKTQKVIYLLKMCVYCKYYLYIVK